MNNNFTGGNDNGQEGLLKIKSKAPIRFWGDGDNDMNGSSKHYAAVNHLDLNEPITTVAGKKMFVIKNRNSNATPTPEKKTSSRIETYAIQYQNRQEAEADLKGFVTLWESHLNDEESAFSNIESQAADVGGLIICDNKSYIILRPKFPLLGSTIEDNGLYEGMVVQPRMYLTQEQREYVISHTTANIVKNFR